MDAFILYNVSVGGNKLPRSSAPASCCWLFAGFDKAALEAHDAVTFFHYFRQKNSKFAFPTFIILFVSLIPPPNPQLVANFKPSSVK